MEDNRDPYNPPIHKVILQPKSSDVKMLDLSYETYAPTPRSSEGRIARVLITGDTMEDNDSSTPTGDEAPGSTHEHEWDSSLFINLRSIKVVTMYGFLMVVKDFIVAPLIPAETTAVGDHEKKVQPSRNCLFSLLGDGTSL